MVRRYADDERDAPLGQVHKDELLSSGNRLSTEGAQRSGLQLVVGRLRSSGDRLDRCVRRLEEALDRAVGGVMRPDGPMEAGPLEEAALPQIHAANDYVDARLAHFEELLERLENIA